jgi:CDP-diacylglycerol--serine O-phosphatidyltransferase
MNFIKNNLANAFTLGNLFSGSIGVINLISGNYKIAALCIITSLVLDFLDGFIARALKANSNLGAQLDSLADMVSFGVLPGVAMFKALEGFDNHFMNFEIPFQLKYLGLFVTLFSCLRLAIFNLDEEQTYYFKGLNTPSNTVLLFGLLYAFEDKGYFWQLFENPIYLLGLIAVSCWLLISPIKMIAIKFKSMLLKDNYPKIVLAIGSLLILSIFGIVGIPMVVIFYIIISLIFQKQLK